MSKNKKEAACEQPLLLFLLLFEGVSDGILSWKLGHVQSVSKMNEKQKRGNKYNVSTVRR